MDKKILIGIIVAVLVIVGIIFAFNAGSSDKETVHIGYLPSDHDAALFVANGSGMYKDKGINVELHEYNNGGDLMSAMASGKVDVGYVGITPALASIEKGVPIKITAGAQTEGSGLVSHDSSISSIEDLKGKTIATPGQASIQYMLLQYDLKKHNMSMSDINSPGMKVSSMNDALKTGSIDAMLTYEPYVSIAEKVNNETVVEKSGDILEKHPCCVVVMSDSFLNGHSSQASEIINIHKEATEKLRNNPKDCVQYLPSSIVPDKDVEAGILSQMNWVSDLNDDYKQSIHQFIDIERDLGIINSTFTDNQLFYQ